MYKNVSFNSILNQTHLLKEGRKESRYFSRTFLESQVKKKKHTEKKDELKLEDGGTKVTIQVIGHQAKCFGIGKSNHNIFSAVGPIFQ